VSFLRFNRAQSPHTHLARKHFGQILRFF